MSVETNEDKFDAKEKAGTDSDDEKDGGFDDDCQFIFPQRLMSILSDERNSDSICWLPHGRAFAIRNRKLFAEKIMPKFFPRKSKYSSFTRKLNRWNFVRVSSGPELGAYYHEFFLRDRPHLAAQMFCKNARTKIAMASSNEVRPASLNHSAAMETKMAQTQQSRNQLDPAQMFLLQQQQLDPAVQLFIQQQLTLYSQDQLAAKQQALKQQNPRMGLGVDNTIGLPLSNNLFPANKGPAPSLSLQQHIQAQKEQQAQFMQLQQFIASSLRRPPKKQPKSTNFRASAA